ncbi:TerB family tellurite resistance protein [Methylocapsa polymorpha]|uniref:TerB family tellurite resistance protein n=1 Tax=Methylocapsa polymorpha TaxID=3080828 RepID=A0ABZ0HX14_9HYPH|nr:TerB family tellurite resistance protein [Methylocapsa sp. RX1]
MFDALKTFIAEVTGAEAADRGFGEDDYRLAAVALLVHTANVDGQTDLAERRRLKAIIEERFGLDERATAELIHQAELSDRDAVDFFHFTSVLKRALDEDGRIKIIEMMWEIAFADGAIDELEENTIWRVAELLGVSTRDRVLLRQRVAGQTPPEAEFQSPWSAALAKGRA